MSMVTAQPDTPSAADLMAQLVDAMNKISTMQADYNAREQQFHAHVRAQEASAAQREAGLRNELDGMRAALQTANDAGWITSAPKDQPGATKTTSAQAPTPPASPPKGKGKKTQTNSRTPSAVSESPISPSVDHTVRAKKASKADIYRMKQADLQKPEVVGYITSFKTHILILLNMLGVTDVPRQPDPADLERFAASFSSLDSVMQARNGSPRIATSLIQIAAVGRNVDIRKGTHAQRAGRVEKSALSYMATFLSRYGISSWAPDFTSTPYSVYNSACRIIALESFQQALLAHAYIHFGPVITLVNDMSFMIKLYDWYVWHYLYKIWDQERRRPGQRLRNYQLRLTYQWRLRLRDRRVKICTEHGLHRYAKAFEDPKCHSDEEFSAGQYIVHEKKGRNPRVTAVLRGIDQLGEEDARRLGRSISHVRVHIENPPPSVLPTLPAKATLDWFDVSFFNSLSVRVRRAVGNPGIALHPADDHVRLSPAHAVEKLSMKEFMANYGEMVMSQYDIPDSDDDEDDGNTSDNDYWLREKRTDEEMDIVEDEEDMASAVDAALTEQQDIFYLKLSL